MFLIRSLFGDSKATCDIWRVNFALLFFFVSVLEFSSFALSGTILQVFGVIGGLGRCEKTFTIITITSITGQRRTPITRTINR